MRVQGYMLGALELFNQARKFLPGLQTCIRPGVVMMTPNNQAEQFFFLKLVAHLLTKVIRIDRFIQVIVAQNEQLSSNPNIR